jgi:hypothetical protein
MSEEECLKNQQYRQRQVATNQKVACSNHAGRTIRINNLRHFWTLKFSQKVTSFGEADLQQNQQDT